MQTPAVDRVVRVFISSTFRDFEAERRILVNEVFPQLRRRARARMVEVIEVDLRWGITQEEAERGEVLPICLREIERSRPYFLGLVGHRYGWTPAPGHYSADLVSRYGWLREHMDGTSITELEVLHGVVRAEGMGGRAIFYMRSEGESLRRGMECVAGDPAERRRLQRFREVIASAPGVRIRDAWNLDGFAELVMDDLWRCIDEDFPAATTPDADEVEDLIHHDFAERRRRTFVGRDHIISELRRMTSGPGAADAGRAIVLAGASGSGKSALLAQCFSEGLPERGPAFVHHLGASVHSGAPQSVARRLRAWASRTAGRRAGGRVSERTDLDSGARQVIAETLAEIGGRAGVAPAVVVLDAIDQADASEGLDWLPTHIPPGVVVVLSCTPGRMLDACLARGWTRVDLPPLEPQEREAFVEGYLQQYVKRLDAELVRRIVAHPLAELPIFVKGLLDELRFDASFEDLESRLQQLLRADSFAEFFGSILARCERECGEGVVRDIASALVNSRMGLVQADLLGLASTSLLDLSRLRLRLDEHLIESGGRLRFLHEHFVEAVKQRYGRDGHWHSLWRQRMLAWFEREAEPSVAEAELVQIYGRIPDRDRAIRWLAASGCAVAAFTQRGTDGAIEWLRVLASQAEELGALIRSQMSHWEAGIEGERLGRMRSCMLAALDAIGCEFDGLIELELAAISASMPFVVASEAALDNVRAGVRRLLRTAQQTGALDALGAATAAVLGVQGIILSMHDLRLLPASWLQPSRGISNGIDGEGSVMSEARRLERIQTALQSIAEAQDGSSRALAVSVERAAAGAKRVHELWRSGRFHAAAAALERLLSGADVAELRRDASGASEEILRHAGACMWAVARAAFESIRISSESASRWLEVLRCLLEVLQVLGSGRDLVQPILDGSGGGDLLRGWRVLEVLQKANSSAERLETLASVGAELVAPQERATLDGVNRGPFNGLWFAIHSGDAKACADWCGGVIDPAAQGEFRRAFPGREVRSALPIRLRVVLAQIEVLRRELSRRPSLDPDRCRVVPCSDGGIEAWVDDATTALKTFASAVGPAGIGWPVLATMVAELIDQWRRVVAIAVHYLPDLHVPRSRGSDLGSGDGSIRERLDADLAASHGLLKVLANPVSSSQIAVLSELERDIAAKWPDSIQSHVVQVLSERIDRAIQSLRGHGVGQSVPEVRVEILLSDVQLRWGWKFDRVRDRIAQCSAAASQLLGADSALSSSVQLLLVKGYLVNHELQAAALALGPVVRLQSAAAWRHEASRWCSLWCAAKSMGAFTGELNPFEEEGLRQGERFLADGLSRHGVRDWPALADVDSLGPTEYDLLVSSLDAVCRMHHWRLLAARRSSNAAAIAACKRDLAGILRHCECFAGGPPNDLDRLSAI